MVLHLVRGTGCERGGSPSPRRMGRGALWRRREESGEESDYAAPEEARRLPRGAYPRGFGHENEKLGAVRKVNLIRKSDPALRNRWKKERGR